MSGGLTLLATAVGFAISLVVGLRILWIARRTRGLPELTLGFALFVSGTVTYPILVAGRVLEGLGPEERGAFWAAGIAVHSLAMLALYVFTWRVFRPHAGWARGLFVAAVVLLFGGLAGQGLFGPGYAAQQPAGLFGWLGFAARAGAYLWGCFEALRYGVLLRRRAALGLASPVVTHRVLLWGLASGLQILNYVNFTYRYVASDGNLASAPVAVTNLALTLLGAVALWLAFLPPRSYLRRLEAREASPAG